MTHMVDERLCAEPRGLDTARRHARHCPGGMMTDATDNSQPPTVPAEQEAPQLDAEERAIAAYMDRLTEGTPYRELAERYG